jgi:hypothetical protein
MVIGQSKGKGNKCMIPEHRPGVFENRVLMRIFGPKKDEVIEAWRISHNEEPHIFYSSSNIIRMIKSVRVR